MENTIINLIWLIYIGLILIILHTMSMNTTVLTKKRITYVINIFYAQIENHFELENRETDKKNLVDVLLKLEDIEKTNETELLGFVRNAMKVYAQNYRPTSLTDQVLDSAYSNALNEILPKANGRVASSTACC